jgi:hypothetical protein
MAGFAITHEVVLINGPFLKKPHQLELVPVTDAPDGHMFFHCVMTNAVLKQLLVDNRFIPIFETRAKALRKTSILGTMQKLKNIKWQNHVDRLAFAKSAIGRYSIPATKAKVLAFPKFIDIAAPKTMTVDSITVTVCLSKPGEGLVMRLTPEVLEYLRAVVTEQLEIGGCSTIAHPLSSIGVNRVNTGVANLFWSYRTCKYRARHHPVTDDDGHTPRRTEFITKSKRRALLFIETGDRGKSSDDEDRSSPDPSEAGGEDVAEDTDEAEDEDMEEVVQRVRKRPSRCSASGSRRVHRR